jgi:predicted nuclease with RNAse H fold
MGNTICGVDLAGVPSRPTGMCILADSTHFYTVYDTESIIATIHRSTPDLVAIDAPLSFHGKPFRDGDKALRKDYPILPLTFKGMQALTRRASHLVSCIPYTLIEVYPYAAKQILNITQNTDLPSCEFSTFPANIHELDAAVCALTGKYYLQGTYKKYGEKDPIIVPR